MWLGKFRAAKKAERQITEIVIASRDLQQMYTDLRIVQSCLKELICKNTSNVRSIQPDMNLQPCIIEKSERLECALAHANSIQRMLDAIIIKAS